jgi:Flp pilus assembly protein TadG
MHASPHPSPAARPRAAALRDRKGVSTLEFGLVAPVLILVLLGVFDLGNALQQSIRLESAARAGAQYAFAYPGDEAGIAAAVRANLTGWSNVVVQRPVRVCKCADGTGVDCSTGTCDGGATLPITYISVTVTRPFVGISPLTASIFSSLTTLTGNVEIRLQ